MNPQYIRSILESTKNGSVTIDEAMQKLQSFGYDDIGFAKIDNHRHLRTGFPEIVFCQGKKDSHLVSILEKITERGNNILATRASIAQFEIVNKTFSDAVYHDDARIITVKRREIPMSKNRIAVVTAGTADIAVAEEAAVTAENLGTSVERIFDVGVAGLHRLLSNAEKLNEAEVIIAIAGMEGALASVVGGLVDKPIIAVPTSVGYGASFGGISALLTMLNSCASGVAVVNIDNGFGAAFIASQIIRRLELK
jgi:NCAIR mutase (PurE)-related protein